MNASRLSSLTKKCLIPCVVCCITFLLLICTTLPAFAASLAPVNVAALHSGIDQVPWYGFLIDPNIVFLLFIVAMVGLYVEISHPGAIVPGVVGAIALLLFLLGAGSLAPNWAGFALMVLAFVLLVLDMWLPAHGILTAGAVVSLVVGSLLFFNSGGPFDGQRIDPLIVYIMSGFLGALGLLVAAYVARSRRLHVNNGIGGMIGARVTALTPLMPDGRVWYGGEDWAAVLDSPEAAVDTGTLLIVTSVEGLRLHVRPVVLKLPGEETQQDSILCEGIVSLKEG